MLSFLGAFYILFLPLSLLNQIVRTRLWLLAPISPASPEEWFGWFTPIVSAQLRAIRQWNWTSVGIKSIEIAIFTTCLIGGLQFAVTIFLVWFVSALATTPPWATVVIFMVTSIVRFFHSRHRWRCKEQSSATHPAPRPKLQSLLFFIPWLAAVPIYFAGGVALTGALRSDSLGFWGATAAAVAICSLTKAISVIGLHRRLGRRWMRDAGMRKAFGLRTLTMRALEMIIMRPGLDRAKILLLVAGPDWPIGVLSGMLDVKLRTVLVTQTVPTLLLLVAPTTIAGAAQLRAQDGAAWITLSGWLLLFAAAVQGMGMLAFNFYVSSTADENEAFLKDKPSDREVEELEELFERTEAPQLRALEVATQWQGDQLPPSVRASIVASTFAMLLACSVLRFGGASCLASLQLNDALSCPSPAEAANPRRLHVRTCYHSDVRRIVFTGGWVVVGFFMLGYICKKRYERWCVRKLAEIKASGEVEGDKAPRELVKVVSFSRQRFTAKLHVPESLGSFQEGESYILT